MPWFLVLLLGCAPTSSPAPARAAGGDLEFEKSVAMQVLFDPLLVKSGDFAIYALKAPGALRPEHYQWSAVESGPKGVWVENRVPHAGTGMIVKTLYDPTGGVAQVWMGPPGGVPAQVWPKPGAPAGAAPGRHAAPPPAAKEEVEPVNAAGRTLRCLKLTSSATYPDGRRASVVSWYAPEVPFAGQARYGGLVKRQVGRAVLELAAFGRGRVRPPELQIPR